jgi:hypothetical protein
MGRRIHRVLQGRAVMHVHADVDRERHDTQQRDKQDGK